MTPNSPLDRLLDRDFATARALDRDGVTPWSPRITSSQQDAPPPLRSEDPVPRAPIGLRFTAFCLGLVALAALAATFAAG